MSETIESLLAEGRTFPPSDEFKKTSPPGPTSTTRPRVDFEGFWARQATALDWFEDWHTVLEWDFPFAKWFVGGKLNVAYNCLDRHVTAGHGDQVAVFRRVSPATPARSPTRSSSTTSAGSPTP